MSRDWFPTKARFLSSGRARQTPLAIWVQGRWLEVRLLGEELVAPLEGPGHLRRYRLEDRGGRRWELRQDQEGWLCRGLH